MTAEQRRAKLRGLFEEYEGTAELLGDLIEIDQALWNELIESYENEEAKRQIAELRDRARAALTIAQRQLAC